MKIIRNIFDLNKAIKNFKKFGFVPTMGGIHQGHISLIKNSQKTCKKTIVSIFINPTQFNSKTDYKKYPTNIEYVHYICYMYCSSTGGPLLTRIHLTRLFKKVQQGSFYANFVLIPHLTRIYFRVK